MNRTKAMNHQFQKRTALRAWLASLPLALGLPVAGWIIIFGIAVCLAGGRTGLTELVWLATILGIAVLVHFVGYLLTGLPLFLYHYKNPRSPLWMPIPSLFFGALLGLVLVIALFGEGRLTFEPSLFLIGAAYGTFTAIAALRQRPARH